MSLPKKLVVTADNETIFLTGIMDESMNTFGLKEALKGNFTRIDLGGVTSASWNSLLRFDELVRDRGASTVTLDRLPFSVYRFLRMSHNFDDLYRVTSLEVPVLEIKSRTLLRTTYKSGSPEAQALLDTGRRGRELSLFGRHQHFKALFSDLPLDPSWATEELADVLLDYVQFCEIIFALVHDIAKSVEASIGVSVREFESQTLCIEKAVKHANLGAEYTKITEDLKKLLREIKPELSAKSSQIMEALEPVQGALNEIAGEALACLAEGKPCPSDLSAKAVTAIRSAIPVLALAEDFGIIIGQLYTVFDLKKIERPYLTALSSRNLSPVEIKGIIDIYCILDPMAEDQSYLEDCISDYFNEIDDEIAKISAMSQGCDLVRQIIEHRINESQIIDDLRSQTQPDKKAVREFRDKLIAMIKKRMVTDQEKSAMRFYMPEEAVEEVATARPGEMLMFDI